LSLYFKKEIIDVHHMKMSYIKFRYQDYKAFKKEGDTNLNK